MIISISDRRCKPFLLNCRDQWEKLPDSVVFTCCITRTTEKRLKTHQLVSMEVGSFVPLAVKPTVSKDPFSTPRSAVQINMLVFGSNTVLDRVSNLYIFHQPEYQWGQVLLNACELSAWFQYSVNNYSRALAVLQLMPWAWSNNIIFAQGLLVSQVA